MTTPVVSTMRLTKTFGPVRALDGLDLDVMPGEVLAVLGPNGAGKTTLIRLLLGMLRPTSGRAVLFGLDATREAARAHRRLAYIPGETAFWPELTGTQTLHLLGQLHGKVDVPYRDELIETFDFDPSKKARAYSKGNRQKLAIIAALMTRADLLVLDEPSSGLDPLMAQRFQESIRVARDRGQTVLLSSHILSEAEALSDRIAILRSGLLADLGTLDELRHLSALEVRISFAGKPPDLSSVPGVSNVRAEDRVVRCAVRGPMDPLLRVLARHRVVQLTSREPSLEELFLAHYGTAPPSGVGDVA